MAYYRVCPYCKGNLDPGEKCDCQNEIREQEKKMSNLIAFGSDGQAVFQFIDDRRKESV